MTREERARMRATGYPKDPATCQHRRWSPVIDIPTGKYLGREACWYCGMAAPQEPATEAGRRLFTDNEPMDMLESDGVTWADVAAIEDEMAARTAALEAFALRVSRMGPCSQTHHGWIVLDARAALDPQEPGQ